MDAIAGWAAHLRVVPVSDYLELPKLGVGAAAYVPYFAMQAWFSLVPSDGALRIEHIFNHSTSFSQTRVTMVHASVSAYAPRGTGSPFGSSPVVAL